jgi:hypothetical protein
MIIIFYRWSRGLSMPKHAKRVDHRQNVAVFDDSMMKGKEESGSAFCDKPERNAE